MKLISLQSVKDSVRIAKGIYAYDGRKLLAEGHSLKANYIRNLKEWGISSIYIQDQHGNLEIDTALCQETKTEVRQGVIKILSAINENQYPDGTRDQVQKVIEKLLADEAIIKNLAEVRALNGNSFQHSVSVCILSLINGITLNCDQSELKQLGAGAILIELGKTSLSSKLLVNPSLLSEAERLELADHPRLGYERLNQFKRYQDAALILLQHHERYDGSGYPQGLTGNGIHKLTKIVALADAYYCLVNEGMNGRKMLPHEVIEYIRDNSVFHFDPDITRQFLKSVTTFLIGSHVLLNTGEKAKVIRVNPHVIARPVVRVIIDSEGQLLAKPIEKDLEQDLTLFIVDTLKESDMQPKTT